jgi:prepilin-type N-terminal cleavage/methylation domain-containing protein
MSTTSGSPGQGPHGSERGFTLIELLITSVVMLVVLGIVVQIVAASSAVYNQQRQYADGRDNAAASVDTIVRLLRSSTAVTPDPDANGVLDSVRVVGDWNPYDGDTADAYEDMTFTVAGGQLRKQEPVDAGPVAFAERVAAVQFQYRNAVGTVLATPVNVAQIAFVTVTITATPVNGAPGRILTASASIRRRE